MANNAASHILDHAIWHALNTNHAHFAISTGLATRYDPDVCLFTDVAELSAAALRDLAAIIAPGEIAIVGSDELPPGTEGWTVQAHVSVPQMMSQQPPAEIETSESVLDLTAEDVPDMLELVRVTEPGPFLPRTIEMGHYIGIRQEGRLIAMAGERLYPPGYREISAVCTHPDYQRKGYAQLLVTRLVRENWARGDVPFLHISADNTRAQRLYERLHFRVRDVFPLLIISY
jgi:predicted GNAT family acetyltransferase